MIVKSLKEWHKVVCERDGYICQYCFRDFNYPCYFQGAINQHVCGDHILTQKAHPELRLETDNGKTTCIECHNNRHNNG